MLGRANTFENEISNQTNKSMRHSSIGAQSRPSTEGGQRLNSLAARFKLK